LYAIRYLKRLDSDGIYDVTALAWILLYVLLSSIIKYTSLPLSAALVAILAGVTLWKYRKRPPKDMRTVLALPGRVSAAALLVGLLVLGGLAVERYGLNLAQFHSPVPDCSRVLTVEQCQAYSPWARDYFYESSHPKPSAWGLFVYPGVWVHRMVFETMFTISSRFNADGVVVTYIPAPPLTVANYTAWAIVTAGSIFTLLFARRLWHMEYLRWLLLAIGLYTTVLFVKNLSMYLHTGEAMAIHGRYLIPVYPVLYAALALGFGWFFERIRRPELKTELVVLTALLFIHGAGLVVWIFRSDPSWYWSDNPKSTVYQINRPVQEFFHRVIVP
jgi:hypothetical protein